MKDAERIEMKVLEVGKESFGSPYGLWWLGKPPKKERAATGSPLVSSQLRPDP
jgi:hypothetical protein